MIKIQKSALFVVALLGSGIMFSNCIWAQRDVSKAVGTPYISIQYGANITGGDLAERYGFTNSIGVYGGYKTKRNWIYALDANFFFGNNIRIEGMLQNLKDSKGEITNTSGGPSIVRLFNRGFNVNVSVGKIFPIWSPNPNSGIMIRLGAGYRFHMMKIGHHNDEIPQLAGEYKKGYDRLTIGLNTSEFIGYNFMANQGVFNFYAGFYFQQTFMQNQRTHFFDHPNQQVSKKIRMGQMYGIRVGWLIPIYKRQPKDFYYN